MSTSKKDLLDQYELAVARAANAAIRVSKADRKSSSAREEERSARSDVYVLKCELMDAMGLPDEGVLTRIRKMPEEEPLSSIKVDEVCYPDRPAERHADGTGRPLTPEETEAARAYLLKYPPALATFGPSQLYDPKTPEGRARLLDEAGSIGRSMGRRAEESSSVSQPIPQTDNRLKVSIIGPHFLFGDIERFLCDLMAHTDREKIRWMAVASREQDMVAAHPEIAKAGAQLTGGPQGIVDAIMCSDLIIVWGGLPVPYPLPDGKRVLSVDIQTIEPMIDPVRMAPTRSKEEVRAELKVRPDQKVIGFFGEIVNRNNPYALVQTLRVLNDGNEADPEYVGIFVGEGNDLPDLHGYIQRIFGWNPKMTRLLGVRGDIGDLLRATDVVLSPRLLRNGRYDVFQAWAAGAPVVGTPVCSPDERLGVLLVPRAVEDQERDLPAPQLQTQEIAEKIGTEYAGAIREVLDDLQAGGVTPTTQRMVYGGNIVVKESDSFGATWTERLLLRGGREV